MPKPNKRKQPAKAKNQADVLKGWQQIAGFLSQPISVAQRWQKSGMPVKHDGRNVIASPEELTQWVGAAAGKSKPVHLASESEDLAADLKAGLSFVRQQRKTQKPSS